MKKAPTKKLRGNAVRAKTATRETPTRTGRRHTKPLVILYREGRSTVCAIIMQPDSTKERVRAATGVYSALGLLMDDGYKFGTVRNWVGIPPWALARVPTGCKTIGYATITGFPL